MKKKNIHFWVLYPERSAPSQRFRVELFLPLLSQNGFAYELLSFLDLKTWSIFYKKGYGFTRAIGIIKGFFRRIIHLFKSLNADYIFILREATPVGPPIFEWLLSKIFRKKIIYDFDDAIWLPGGEKISWIKRFMKATWKTKNIIKWAYKISAGNDFLASYARQFNSSVFIIPTVVDTERGHYKQKDQKENNKLTVGWTGTHTTLHNLEVMQDILPELKKEIDFDILIISNKPPAWNFDFIYKQWNADTEQDDLLKMHIGLMPLKQGPWFEGKCGFKLIQYHACGIPAIASPVGVNTLVTLHNKTGFIASSKEEWKIYLKELLNNAQLRSEMAVNARHHIEKNYSLNSLFPAFISLFS
jgi:glycosyltransferase involved in cell wall biosynthesis